MLNAVSWILNKLGLKGPEFIFIGILIAGVVTFSHYLNSYVDSKADKVVAENAIEASRLIYQYQQERQTIDLDVVNNYIEKRDRYLEQQEELIDTTFLAFFEQSTSDVEPLEQAEPHVTKEHDNEATPPPTNESYRINSNQLDILADGMWDNYCLAITGTSEACEGRTTHRSTQGTH